APQLMHSSVILMAMVEAYFCGGEDTPYFCTDA
ncbi:MAG: hypothetical protein RL206_345, partial [Bacteroidota bacterium]